MNPKSYPNTTLPTPNSEEPKLVPRKHTKTQFQGNGSVLLRRGFYRWPGRRVNGSQLEVDVPADQGSARIHPSSEALLVGSI